jgi:hypothetical protein
MHTERRDSFRSTTGLGGRRKFSGAPVEVQERTKSDLGGPFLAFFARNGVFALKRQHGASEIFYRQPSPPGVVFIEAAIP